MKRFLVFIGSILWFVTALHGQTLNRDALNVSSVFGYPLSVGNATAGDNTWYFNQLTPDNADVPRYQIGEIPVQTVWHDGDVSVVFLVTADENCKDVTYSCSADPALGDRITIDPETGKFVYYPDKSDVRNFTVTFTAQACGKEFRQEVLFIVMPAESPEVTAFGVKTLQKMPPPDEYTFISGTKLDEKMYFNNQTTLRDVYSYSISGKEVVFDSQYPFLVRQETLYELNIYAETLIIRDVMSFPSTNVTIYAKELIFENNASIDTSPVAWTGTGSNNGRDAGNITLYIKDFKQIGDQQTRFIATGGNGQNSNTTGGNGGNLFSTVNLNALFNLNGGNSGNNVTGNGKVGKFEIINKEFEWLHPNFVGAVIKHAKDAYLNSNDAATDSIFKAYTGWFAEYAKTAEWNALSDHDERKMELVNANLEMQAIRGRIAQNLDYFGNPFGWAPMLSFEAYMAAFNKEIENAINVMYLCYWLGKEADNNIKLSKAKKEAYILIGEELDVNQDELSRLDNLIPDLQIKADSLQVKIEDLTDKIDDRYEQLRKKAESNVKKQNELNTWATVLKITASVAPVANLLVPGLGTVIGLGATAGYAALNLTTGATDTSGYGDAFGDIFKAVSSYNKISGELVDKKFTYENYSKVQSSVTDLVKSADNLYKVFTQNAVLSDQVQAELDKLLSQSKDFKQLIEESEVLNGEKEALIQKLVTVFDNIVATGVAIQNNFTALDALGVELSEGDSKRDLRVKQYLDAMDRSARERLLKCHYYVAKAFEYRMLNAYDAQLDLNKTFDKFKDVPNKEFNYNEFNSFKSTYEEQISKIRAGIVFNGGMAEKGNTIPIKLTVEDLKALNNGDKINLNLFERGHFLPDEENIRILNFTVSDGYDVDSEDRFDLQMVHSGISKFRYEGDIYYFNHITSQNKENPIYWRHSYSKNATSGMFNTFTESAANYSLLYNLLEISNDKTMLYSRPGAWADICIYIIPVDDAKVEIKQLTFDLKYDVVPRSPNSDLRNLDIYARDIDGSAYKLSPYIILTEEDIKHRSNGRAPMYRTYNSRTLSSVNVEAPQEYGLWKFEKWTNRKGDVVYSTKAKERIDMTKDEVWFANYRWTGPLLFAPKTVPVSNESGEKNIDVTAQKGADGDDIKWSVRSESPWIRSTGSGKNNGSFTVNFSANPDSEKDRTGYVTVIPDDDSVDPVVVAVIQSKGTTSATKTEILATPLAAVYPNPTDGTITLQFESEGVYHLTLTDMTGRILLHKTVSDKITQLDISNFPSGVFLLTIDDGKQQSAVRVVKN